MSDTVTVKIPPMADCEFTLYADQDHLSVKGNAMASGDDEVDRACEDEIFKRLDEGDVWAWALVTVVCRYKHWSVTGRAFLGACSYRDEADFKAGEYYEDLKEQAYEDFVWGVELMGEGDR